MNYVRVEDYFVSSIEKSMLLLLRDYPLVYVSYNLELIKYYIYLQNQYLLKKKNNINQKY